jgi:hypothetical protein
MIQAVCIQCGTPRKRPTDRCNVCHFKPSSDEEKAKSLMLSNFYEIDGEYRGKTQEELKAIGENIRDGKVYKFDPQEVAQVFAYAHEVMSIPTKRLVRDLVKWLAIPLGVLLAVLLLLWAMR